MKKLNVILFLGLAFSIQNSFSNYFLNQVAVSALAGTTGCIMNQALKKSYDSNANTKTFLFLGSYVTLKFFYDALTANTAGEVMKSFVSVPLNAGVSIGTLALVDSFTNKTY